MHKNTRKSTQILGSNLPLTWNLNEFPCHYVWSYSEEGLLSHREKHIETCLEHCEGSPDPTVYNCLGFLYVKRGDFLKAETAFKQALELVSEEPVALANLVHFYFKQGREREAEACLEQLKMVTGNTLTAWQHWSRAYFYTRLFRYKEAVEDYTQCIDVIDGLPEQYRYKPYLLEGILLNRLAKKLKSKHANADSEAKRYQAIEVLNRALELNSQDYLVYLQLAIAYGSLTKKKLKQKAKNFRQSQEYFKKALSLASDDANVINRFGEVMAKHEKFDVALKYFTQSIEANKNTPKGLSAAYHRRGVLYWKCGYYEQAEADLEQAVSCYSYNFPAAMQLIEVYTKNRKHADAVRWCAQLSEQMSEPTASLLYYKADNLQEQGNREAAVATYERLLQMKKAPVRFTKKAKKAVLDYYQEVYESNDDRDALIALINWLDHFDANSEVLRYLKSGCEQFPQNAWLRFEYGKQLLRTREGLLEGAELIAQAFRLTTDVRERGQYAQVLYQKYYELLYDRDGSEFDSNSNSNSVLDSSSVILDAFKKIYISIEDALHKDEALNWSCSLGLFYPSKKPMKQLDNIDGVKTHQYLRSKMQRQLDSRYKMGKPPKNLNYANTQLTFIVSDRPHQPSGEHIRQLVEIPGHVVISGRAELDSEKHANLKNVYDAYTFEFVFNDHQSVPRSQELLKDVLISMPVSEHESIMEDFESPKSRTGFHRNFHCSERALFAMLNQNIEGIVDAIASKTRHQSGLKVYALILDIHTQRYFCGKCETSAFFWYQPSGSFIQRLVAALEHRGYKVSSKSHTLDVALRISAEEPAYRQQKKTFEAHQSDLFDLKKASGGVRTLVLQQDCNSVEETSPLNATTFSNLKRK